VKSNQFRVVDVTDCDCIIVAPRWIWRGVKGDKICPVGYYLLKERATDRENVSIKMKSMLIGKKIELMNPIKLYYDRLLCEILFDGKDLSEYFPEYEESVKTSLSHLIDGRL